MQQVVDGVLLQAAVPDANAGSFTIHLTKPASAPVHVAWFVIN